VSQNKLAESHHHADERQCCMLGVSVAAASAPILLAFNSANWCITSFNVSVSVPAAIAFKVISVEPCDEWSGRQMRALSEQGEVMPTN